MGVLQVGRMVRLTDVLFLELVLPTVISSAKTSSPTDTKNERRAGLVLQRRLYYGGVSGLWSEKRRGLAGLVSVVALWSDGEAMKPTLAGWCCCLLPFLWLPFGFFSSWFPPSLFLFFSSQGVCCCGAFELLRRPIIYLVLKPTYMYVPTYTPAKPYVCTVCTYIHTSPHGIRMPPAGMIPSIAVWFCEFSIYVWRWPHLA